MSLLIEKEFPCLHCKHPNTLEVWSIVNAKEDPELKDLILGGELNMAECVACHTVFYAENFLIYHDPPNELMAFVYPRAYEAEKDKWRNQAREDFERALNEKSETGRYSYQAVALFGLDELVAAIEKDEETRLQGEIVEVISNEQGWPVKKLSPYSARMQALPPVLPLLNGKETSIKARVLAGLDALRSVNDQLSVYNETRDRLAQNGAADLNLD